MARRLVVAATQDPYLFSWCELGRSDAATFEASHGTLVDIQELVAGEPVQITLLAPAQDVLLKTLVFSDKERRLVVQTVPGELEVNLITDVDEMHIVMDKPRGNRLTVAAVDKERMQFWIDLFAEAGLLLHQIVPAQSVMLPANQDWAMHYHEGEYLLRLSETEVVSMAAENLTLAMELATKEFADMPSQITLTISEDSDRETALKHLPQALQHITNVSHSSIASLATERLDYASTWNFLRGQFGRSQEWAALWSQWRAPVVFVALVLMMQLGMNYGRYVQLDVENVRLRQEMQVEHRKVFPKGQIVDSRKQINNELRRLEGGAGGSFIQKLSQLGSVLHEAAGLEINSITYDEKNGDVRLDVVVDSFEEVEKIKTKINKVGLESELLNSNAQGEQIRARLRVKG